MSDREHAPFVGALAPADTHFAPPNLFPTGLIPQQHAPEGIAFSRPEGECRP